MLTKDELLALKDAPFLVKDNKRIKAIGARESLRGIGNTNTHREGKTEYISLQDWAGKAQPILLFGWQLMGPEDLGTSFRILAVVEDVIYLQALFGNNTFSIPFGESHFYQTSLAYDTEWSYRVWGIGEEADLEKSCFQAPKEYEPPKPPSTEVSLSPEQLQEKERRETSERLWNKALEWERKDEDLRYLFFDAYETDPDIDRRLKEMRFALHQLQNYGRVTRWNSNHRDFTSHTWAFDRQIEKNPNRPKEFQALLEEGISIYQQLAQLK